MSSTMTGENAPHESAVDGKPAVELDSSGKGVTDRRTDNPFSSAGEGRTTVMKSGSELSLSLSRRDTGVERSQSINTREEDEETQASSIDAMKSFDSSISPTPDAQTLRPRDGAQAGLPGAFGKRGEGLRENDSSPEMEKRHVPSVPPSSFARYAATTGPSLEVPSQERGGHSDWNGGVGPLVAVRYASDSVLPSSSSSSSSATARGLLHHPVGGKEVDRHGNKSAVSGDDVISHTASCTSQCLGVPRRADAGLLDGTVDATHEGGKIDDEKMGWSYMFKKLLSLNFKDAGAVTYLDKLPTVPAKAGSAAAAAVSPALGPLSSASATRRSVAPPLPPTQSIGSNAVCLPGAQQPQQGLAGGLGYVRMVPSKDLAVASSVCDESVEAVRLLAHALQLRQSWSFAFPEPPRSHAVVLLTEQEKATRRSHEPLYDPTKIPLLPPCNAQFRMVDGVYNVFWDPNTDGSSTTGKRESMHDEQDSSPPLLWADHPIPDVLQFLRALKDIMTAVQNPACKSFCYKRLKYLEGKFNLHLMFNAPAEVAETKYNFHRDFYNVRKVDTHIHHSACMQQKHLLRFIRKKYRTEADTYVAKTRDGREQTLKDMFHSEVGICAHDASVDHLDVHALGSCFQRFDLFNQKYNPFGQRTLRDVFLKTDNYIEGRFLAEITREVISDLEERRYQHVEWRLSIYGRSRDEWAKLAKWVVKNKLFSARVRWMIQVPRLYHVYKRLGMISSFGDLLSNVFEPLFEAVRNPSENPDLFTFLSIIVGWDSVDDESYASKYTMEGGELPRPEDWTGENNPPYSYWGYYMYANIRALNHLLTARGMRPLAFRPHCGEAGSVSHLATMFLLADAINHGIMLKKCPVLQFLFYLAQIGLAVSPLSNNALFMDIAKNPLYSFFKVGMNVSISTDDPLMFHFTDEPLLEEYSVAAHTWKLSPVDLCELARNSVLQSGYEDEFKRHWLGQDYKLGGRRGNNMRQTNVSNIRLQYREDALREELSYMHDVLALRMALSRPLPLPAAPAGCFSLPASTAPSAVSGDFSAAEDTGAHLSQVSLSKKPSPVFSAFSDGGSFKHCKTTEEGPQETPSFRPSLSLSAPTHLVIPQGAFGGERPGDQTQEQRSLGGAGWVNAPAASTPASPCSSPSSPLAHSVSQTLVKGGVKSHQLRAEGGGRGSGGEGGAGIRPLRREAAMKKLLEVAEESAGMEFGDFAGRCTKSPLLRPHSESVDILNGPSREVLQTLGACSHLSKSSDTLAVPSSSSSSNTFLGTESDAGGNSTGGNALAAGTSCNHKGHSGFGPSRSSPQLSACPSSSLPFYTSYAGATLQPAVSTAAESPGVGSEGKGESSGSGVTSPEETGGGGGGVGMLRILTSPLIHEHLSHASSVIVGDYAKSTAEEHDGDEEEQIGETCERGEGGVGGDPCTVGFRGFRLHHATLGGLQNGTEEELRRIEQKTWNESSPWEGGINCVDGDEDGVLDTE